MDKLIPIASIEKSFRNSGGKRVSRNSKVLLKNYIEEHLETICKKIVRITMNARRKTVLIRDVKIVID